MRKLLVLTTLILLSINLKAQDTITYKEPFAAYATAYFGSHHSPELNETGICFGVGLSFYYDLYEDLSIYTALMLNQVCISDYKVYPSISIGVEWYFYNWLYLYGGCTPKIDVHGHSHQIYGDYVSLYSEFDLGLGYWLELGKGHALSLKGGIFKEFTFFNSDYEGFHDNWGINILLSYHYQFNR